MFSTSLAPASVRSISSEVLDIDLTSQNRSCDILVGVFVCRQAFGRSFGA